ncbi:MAG: lytic murein transglycosylase B [Chromatiales bacterium]|jgi:membrane-bound lytic murein transglycosylase B
MRPATLLVTALLSLLPLTGHSNAAREQLKADFINRMVSQHQYPRSQLEQIFRQVKYVPELIPKMQNAPERTWTWGKYRSKLISNLRIRQGVEYWQRHADELQRAEQHFGVPAQVIIAILGIETSYGKNSGDYRVADSLYTLGFYHPRRGPFFRSELEHLLLFSRARQQDPLLLTGSRAGAMGQGQFMPSSYRAYAVDFNQDGRIDIWDTPSDVIGSIANYLARNGWRRGQAVAEPVKVDGRGYRQLLQKKIKPQTSIKQLRQAGVSVRPQLPDNEQAVLMELEGGNGLEHWIGLHNFYVISTYNPRVLYTMAVFQLSEDILRAYQDQQHDRSKKQS